MDCYAARSGNPVLTFRDNLSVPSSRVMNTRSPHRGVQCVISGFRRDIHANCALLGNYAASNGDFLPTLRVNLSVPSSRVMNPRIPHRGVQCVISGFRRDIYENCSLLGNYAANNGDSLPTFRDNLSVPSEFTLVECGRMRYSASSAAGRPVNQSSIPGRSRGVPLLQNLGVQPESCLLSTGVVMHPRRCRPVASNIVDALYHKL